MRLPLACCQLTLWLRDELTAFFLGLQSLFSGSGVGGHSGGFFSSASSSHFPLQEDCTVELSKFRVFANK